MLSLSLIYVTEKKNFKQSQRILENVKNIIAFSSINDKIREMKQTYVFECNWKRERKPIFR